mgnify:CR=1 FL=1
MPETNMPAGADPRELATRIIVTLIENKAIMMPEARDPKRHNRMLINHINEMFHHLYLQISRGGVLHQVSIDGD